MQIKIGRWSDNAGEDNTELKLNYKSDAIYAKYTVTIHYLITVTET